MCRFAAYLGPPRPLSALLYDPPRSLQVQAYAPAEMLSGHVNVDGTGVAWWSAESTDGPLRYVTAATPWADPNLPTLAPRLTGRVQLAAVRSTTPGLSHGTPGVAPFVHDGVAFAHNGWLGEYRAGVGRSLLAGLSDEIHGAVDPVTDSAVLFAVLLEHRRRGADLLAATRRTVTTASAAVAAAGAAATLNLLVSDGARVIAARASHETECNSLYTLRDAGAWPAGAVVASEPLDPALAWEPVPEDHLVTLTSDTIDLEPLRP